MGEDNNQITPRYKKDFKWVMINTVEPVYKRTLNERVFQIKEEKKSYPRNYFIH